MSLPVIFIHLGNSPYLIDTFHQLKQTNPNNPIYLIGTPESNIYKSVVTHIPIDELMQEANIFAKHYLHLSTNSEAFELICLQRWFVLNTFLLKYNIERCLYLDSDVFMYGDIDNLAHKYAHVGITRCGISGHTNFIQQQVLDSLCRYIKNWYIEDGARIILKREAEKYIAKHGGGGISDMTFITKFAIEYPDDVIDLYTPSATETFDPAFNIGEDYFVMEEGFKKIDFQGQSPYGYCKKTNTPVLFHTLHFQGGEAKKIMTSFLQNKTLQYRGYKFMYTGLYFLQKVYLKINRRAHS